MEYNLTFGLSATCTITDLDDNLLQSWSSDGYNHKDFNELSESKPTYPKWHVFFIPTRTDTLKHFCTDLFLPTLINHALEINNFTLKLFVSVIAVANDALFLLPRLAFAIPRYIQKRIVPETPHLILSKLDLTLPRVKAAIQSGYVKIRSVSSVTCRTDEDCASYITWHKNRTVALRSMFYRRDVKPIETHYRENYRRATSGLWGKISNAPIDQPD